uniref:U2 snRNP-associated SURP motif-containing protein n=1 Tax=Globodera rostochiensis TaxID=31243 RepID=A0A914HYV2_GLORO
MDPKVKRKKEKEEKERLEEAFEEFRETFEETGGVKKVVKTFIRGDVVNADKSVLPSPAVYKPSPIHLKALVKPPALETAKKIAEETAKKIMMEAADKTTQKPSSSTAQIPVPNVAIPSVNKPPKPGTKKVVEKPRLSNLEAFKEELKQMQAMRDERKGLRQHLKERLNMPEEELDRIAPSLDQPYGPAGSDPYGEDDPNTTNLYVCNLPADVKLEDFFDTFGTFGPLASARILYPRPEEERRYRETLSGFVAFMSRTDAERAKCAMHQETMRNCELRVSWARPVNMPPLPFYVPLPLRELAMPDPPSGLPFNARPQTDELRSFLQKYGDLPKLGVPLAGEEVESDTQMLEDYKKMIENATVRVVVPTERPLLALIHRVVEFLVRSGPLFEAILMARERQNPMYRFLFDNHHPTHVYYRWRLYTILQGDDRQKWRLDKFKMFAGGSWWQPPPHSLFEQGMPPQLYDSAYVPKRRREKPYEKRDIAPRQSSRRRSDGASSEEEENRRTERRRSRMERDRESEQQRKNMRGVLTEQQRDHLEELLRNLPPEKFAIGDAMVWCLDHAECAKEIAQCIFEALCIKETPLHKKIARTYLVSDILANCAARIKDAFYFRQHFGDCLLRIFVELNETLEGIESRLKAEQFRQRVMLCFRNWEDNAVYPTDLLIQCQNVFLGLVKHGDEETAETSSIDGEPLASEGGEEMDLDGEPMVEEGAEGVDFDGVPIGDGGDDDAEEDIDGVPMDEGGTLMPKTESKMNLESDNRFTVGSWNTIEASTAADANVERGEAPASADAKSKWESIDLHSRWERHEGVAREFVQQQQRDDDEGEHSPLRKKHKLTRLSPDDERSKPNGGVIDNVSSTVSADDEDRRRILREIEVKVMKLQDQLETEGEMSTSEINAELAKCRQRLMAKLDEKTKNKEKKRESDERETNGRGREREKRHGSEKERDHDRDREGRARRRDSLNSQSKREERESDDSKEKRRERSRERERHRERSPERERDREKERRRERDREEAGRKSARSRSPNDRRRR